MGKTCSDGIDDNCFPVRNDIPTAAVVVVLAAVWEKEEEDERELGWVGRLARGVTILLVVLVLVLTLLLRNLGRGNELFLGMVLPVVTLEMEVDPLGRRLLLLVLLLRVVE